MSRRSATSSRSLSNWGALDQDGQPFALVLTARLDGRHTLDVTVPPSSSAEIRLPDGQRLEAAPDVARYEAQLPDGHLPIRA